MRKHVFLIDLPFLLSFFVLLGFQFSSPLTAGDNMQKLKSLYNQHLGRDPDPSGITTYIGGIKSGKMSWGDVEKAITTSPEYNNLKAKARGNKIDQTGSGYARLKALYNELLGRDPDPSGIGTYLGGIKDKKMDWQDVRKAILNSSEYRSRKNNKNTGAGHSTLTEVFSGVPGLGEGDGSNQKGEQNQADSGTFTTADAALPVDLSGVTWVSGDTPISNWPVKVIINSASVSGGTVSWSYGTPPQNWPTTNRIANSPNACIGWITNVNGRWYGAIAEWLLPGMTVQSKILFNSDRGNKKMFHAPLRDFKARKGQVFYLFVCGMNWVGVSNVRERSNLVRVVYQ
ncbi:DUF4214 domain-containing protein [Candidatus Riflebacteria bacterium]